MSISLLNAVSPRGSAGAPAGAIEVLTDITGAPHFMRADLGRFLGLARIKDMFKDVKYTTRFDIKQGAALNSPKQHQNAQDAFVDLEGKCE